VEEEIFMSIQFVANVCWPRNTNLNSYPQQTVSDDVRGYAVHFSEYLHELSLRDGSVHYTAHDGNIEVLTDNGIVVLIQIPQPQVAQVTQYVLPPTPPSPQVRLVSRPAGPRPIQTTLRTPRLQQSGRSVRIADKVLTPMWNSAGTEVVFKLGEDRSPVFAIYNRNDAGLIRSVREHAVRWGRERGVSDPGQVNAIHRSFTEHKYTYLDSR
jgi:hypothetical protein